jgi:hypothetical protein
MEEKMPRCLINRRGVLQGACAALAAGLLCLTAGCGGDGLPVAPAQGTVTYNGKPLEFGSVLFEPVVKGPPARADIQPDGTFVLGTYSTSDGAVIGKHKVRITCFDTQRPGYQPPAGEEGTAGKSLIPEKYTDAETSGFEYEVTADGDNNFNIELKDE